MVRCIRRLRLKGCDGAEQQWLLLRISKDFNVARRNAWNPDNNSTKSFGDFQMSLYMKTVKQLRQNSLPNPWETAWVFWHYTDNYHNYALVLKTNGFQIEKKDNNVRCDCEIFLKTLSTPTVHIGQWQTLSLRVTNSASGTPHIQVWVNGLVGTDFVDNSIHQPNSRQLASGYMGLYDEDSIVNFDDVSIYP